MQKYLLTLAIMFGLMAAVSAETIRATVNGMVCAFCATGIEKTFKSQKEVRSVKVDLKNRLVTIDTKEGQTLQDAKISQLLKNTGYSVVNINRGK
jgi:mercuric ion binding protein